MSESSDTQEATLKIWLSYREHMMGAMQSSLESYDRAILTLSSGGLGISLAVIRYIVPLHEAGSTWLLTLSWILFICAIISTLASFLCSHKALAAQLAKADAYYFAGSERKEPDNHNTWTTITEYVNYFSGSSFIIAVILSVVFVTVNLPFTEADTMKKAIDVQEIPKRGAVEPLGSLPPPMPIFPVAEPRAPLPDAGVLPPAMPIVPKAPTTPETTPPKK